MALVHGAFRRELHNAPGPAATLEQFRVRWDEHLADEECNIVPLINQHITSDEWQQAVARAAEFISRKNLRLGLVLGGYVFDAASASEGQRIMSDVPLPKRVLLQLLARPAFAKYRRKIYG